MLQYGFFDYYYSLNATLNISQDAKAVAKMSGVKTIRPSLLYNAPKSVF